MHSGLLSCSLDRDEMKMKEISLFLTPSLIPYYFALHVLETTGSSTDYDLHGIFCSATCVNEC